MTRPRTDLDACAHDPRRGRHRLRGVLAIAALTVMASVGIAAGADTTGKAVATQTHPPTEAHADDADRDTDDAEPARDNEDRARARATEGAHVRAHDDTDSSPPAVPAPGADAPAIPHAHPAAPADETPAPDGSTGAVTSAPPEAPTDEAAAPAPAPRVVLAAEQLTPRAVMVAYQRVGRSLLLLERQRGLLVTWDLRSEFRAIDVREAIKAPQTCQDAAYELELLRLRIERNQGVDVTAACLHNPLARGCK